MRKNIVTAICLAMSVHERWGCRNYKLGCINRYRRDRIPYLSYKRCISEYEDGMLSKAAIERS